LEVPAPVKCRGGEGSETYTRRLEPDDDAVGKFAEPKMVAPCPVSVLDVIEGFGPVGAVFPFAELADLLGTLFKAAVTATGKKERKQEEGESPGWGHRLCPEDNRAARNFEIQKSNDKKDPANVAGSLDQIAMPGCLSTGCGNRTGG
jgi:hypothetical protein